MPYERAMKASTTHLYDYLNAYVNDLGNVLDMEAIRSSTIRLGVDPLGGAGVHYWGPIAEKYGLKNLSVLNTTVDPTFRFMTVDHDGKIRMDPSSPYAMKSLIDRRDQFDIAFACDTDHDRHGIVTRKAGLLPPNHYLCVMINYLFQNRPGWPEKAAVGKTVVSSQLIDRVAAQVGRPLYEVPVGFKWFVDGLLDGSLGFVGEESAAQPFFAATGKCGRRTRTVLFLPFFRPRSWQRRVVTRARSTRILPGSLASPSMTVLTQAQVSKQKKKLGALAPGQITQKELAGEPIKDMLTNAPANGAATCV